ncbi:hypothetical protein [Micromonospora auratinigra]|uniref:Uncharacterized protein n=1 Tax=Micromonospora auratinigra TaxID=261654 RepID=A0A1A8ZGN7_9ACTN|nr:hypothetical protein [Micromonospora auratinigra]SBT43183.1 hypothetical protein GA0070611_2232 [Micromonospora auratinigra]
MTLGPDKTTCATELREAMRAQLDTMDPPQGGNVDNPQVKPNFDALGDGVWRILTQDAETISAAAQDPTFWAFLAALRTEVEQLRAFDAGLRTAFAAWDPTLPASGATLKAAIAALTVPASTPAAPTSLNGRIR